MLICKGFFRPKPSLAGRRVAALRLFASPLRSGTRARPTDDGDSMDSHNRYDGLDPQAIRTVRIHARRLARRNVIPDMETEDYEQELMLDLYRRIDRVPGRGVRACDRLCHRRHWLPVITLRRVPAGRLDHRSTGRGFPGSCSGVGWPIRRSVPLGWRRQGEGWLPRLEKYRRHRSGV